MKYLIVEVHPAYVVVLDEEGRFIKAANFNYDVGSTVREIVPIEIKENRPKRKVFSLLASAACICIIAIGVYRVNFIPYGTVSMKINPNVTMTLSKREKVLKLEGKNKAGEELIENYDIKGKKDIEVIGDLTNRALNREVLKENGKISIVTNSKNEEWKKKVETAIVNALNLQLKDKDIKIYNEDFPKEEESIKIPMTEPVESVEPVKPKSNVKESPPKIVIDDENNNNNDDNNNDNNDQNNYDKSGNNNDDDNDNNND